MISPAHQGLAWISLNVRASFSPPQPGAPRRTPYPALTAYK